MRPHPAARQPPARRLAPGAPRDTSREARGSGSRQPTRALRAAGGVSAGGVARSALAAPEGIGSTAVCQPPQEVEGDGSTGLGGGERPAPQASSSAARNAARRSDGRCASARDSPACPGRARRLSKKRVEASRPGGSPPPFPLPSRTNWTRLVPRPVLTGHVSSLAPYGAGGRRMRGQVAARCHGS